MDQTDFKIIRVSEPKDSVVDIELELSALKLDEHRRKAVRHHAKELKLPGFRAGHVPSDVAEKYLDEHHILEDAAQDALQESYAAIVETASIKPISSPRVSVKKIAKGEPFVCVISVGIIPSVNLPNYKKIASKIKKEETPIEVTDQEVETLVDSIRSQQKNADGTLPELTDELVQTQWKFETVADFKKNVREVLVKDKEVGEKQKQADLLQKELVRESKLTVPALLIEDELHAYIQSLQERLEGLHMSVETYLEKMGKKEEEFIEESRKTLEEQLKMKFILDEIAAVEEIQPDEKEIKEELSLTITHNPGTPVKRIEAYVREALTRRKTLDLLQKAEF